MAFVQDLARPPQELPSQDSIASTGIDFDYTQLPSLVLASIVGHLSHADQVSLLMVCKAWSLPVAEAMYRAPDLQTSDSFERLVSLLNTPLPALPYPELIRELDIGSSAADDLYMGDLDSTLAVCTNLEVFRLENCFHISNILVRSLSAHCTNLKQVDLPGCPISDSFIPVLSRNCRQIERLDLSFTNLTVASLHAIVLNCDSLLQLDLSECRPLEEDASLDLATKNLTRPLQWLNLRNTSVNDDLLRFVATHCPNLEDLVLESCTEVTDDAVIKVASTCPKLRRLDLSFCDQVTDLSLQAFAIRASSTNGGTLRELYLTACDHISTPAVQNLAEKCTKLELLVLDGCDKLLGTFVQSFASQPSDELECLLEGEAIRRFAAHVPGTNLVTPPASPGRARDPANYKVQVSYATHSKETVEDGNWGRNVSNVYGSAGQDPAAVAAAALEAAKGQTMASLDRSLARKTSRVMLRKRSSMSFAEAAAEAEAAKQERQEKIRERRRSKVYADPTPAPSAAPVSTAAMPIIAPTPISRPVAPAPVPAAEATTAIPLASGRRRSQMPPQATPVPAETKAPVRDGWDPIPVAGWPSTPIIRGMQSPQGESVPQADSWASGPVRAEIAAPVNWMPAPSTPPASPGVQAVREARTAPSNLADPARRRSIPVPAGPPPPGQSTKWAAPAGMLPPGQTVSDTSTPLIAGSAAILATPAASPPTAPAAPASEGEPILLASGRAARAAQRDATAREAANRAPAAPLAARCDSPLSTEPSLPTTPTPAPNNGDTPVLLASGRRRSRAPSTNSAVAEPASHTRSLSRTNSITLPTPPARAPSPALSAAPPVSAPQPWGANPTTWNNPAQLTSASSTWSNTPVSPAPNATEAAFVDPWAKGPPQAPLPSPAPYGPVSTDPWAARPASQGPSPAGYPQQQQYQQQPPAPQHRSSYSGSTGDWNGPQTGAASPLSPNIRLAAATGWGAATPPAIPAASGTHNMWTSTHSAASPSAPYPAATGAPGYFDQRRSSQQPQQMRNGSYADDYAREQQQQQQQYHPGQQLQYPTVSSGGFAYSSQRRGKMLLKLKIETQSGGHQTLAVHEYDDPHQLATEFCSFWDMGGFREPLVRLISVRKTNAVRQRAAAAANPGHGAYH
ncbi:hypothetical protein HKX48_001502 [Thoreauomyces humboldtii]|nr:hypothetical protein HKX48_001502 [Thoreauomyces humboldtii]